MTTPWRTRHANLCQRRHGVVCGQLLGNFGMPTLRTEAKPCLTRQRPTVSCSWTGPVWSPSAIVTGFGSGGTGEAEPRGTLPSPVVCRCTSAAMPPRAAVAVAGSVSIGWRARTLTASGARSTTSVGQKSPMLTSSAVHVFVLPTAPDGVFMQSAAGLVGLSSSAAMVKRTSSASTAAYTSSVGYSAVWTRRHRSARTSILRTLHGTAMVHRLARIRLTILCSCTGPVKSPRATAAGSRSGDIGMAGPCGV